MKAKKICMVISVTLFILGLAFAGLFTFKDIVPDEIEQLLVNLSIGLSTGGLVALLIEIPLTLSAIAYNKRLLKTNSYHTFRSCRALLVMLDTFQDEEVSISESFCTSYIDETANFAFHLLNLDPHMYLNLVKQKQIKRFIEIIDDFTMQRGFIDNKLKIKINTMSIQSLEVGNGMPRITSKDVKYELEQIKSKITPLCDIIHNTLNLVLDKNELQIWQRQLEILDNKTERVRLLLQSKIKEGQLT